jgi:hypothetical protein
MLVAAVAVAPVPKATVIASEKVIVPETPASTLIPVSVIERTFAVTALAKVTDVVKGVLWPILILLATTVPEAKKLPVPFAFKSPKAIEPEPTLPVMVTAPVPAVRVRSLPETEASTLLLKLMLPLPCEVTTKGEVLVTNTSPLKAILELLAALTLPPREMVLVGVIALMVIPLALADVAPTVLPNAILSLVEVTLITDEELAPSTVPAKLIAPVVVTAPPKVTAPPDALTVVTDAAETAPVKPMEPVVVTETAPVVVNAPTLTVPDVEAVVREVAETAPV